MSRDFLSARGRAALSRHQREVAVQLRETQSVDRVLTGALSACDAGSQREAFENYLETIQELRVSLQRLEGFLLQKLLRPCGSLAQSAEEPATASVDRRRAAAPTPVHEEPMTAARSGDFGGAAPAAD